MSTVQTKAASRRKNTLMSHNDPFDHPEKEWEDIEDEIETLDEDEDIISLEEALEEELEEELEELEVLEDELDDLDKVIQDPLGELDEDLAELTTGGEGDIFEDLDDLEDEDDDDWDDDFDLDDDLFDDEDDEPFE
jgi:chromosome segregation ATPase